MYLNAYLSEAFQLEREVRQGFPLSPMLYILVSETLLTAIRKEQDIKGSLGGDGIEIKTKEYADDTTVYVTDLDSVNKTITKYDLVSECELNKERPRYYCLVLLKMKSQHLPT